MNKTRTSTPGLDESTRLLAAFADPVRLRLLSLLNGDREEVCVCHLHGALELPQPTVSRHLAYLRKHGLVAGRKEGLWVHYSLARPRSGLHRILLGCLGPTLGDPEIFDRDRRRLEVLAGCCDRP
ncbi:ArsR/SmtB family transcription factor [Tundrisphaera lichenicola]|uniref:ArsR/SmtB family transcription factor n=1 Tax=Tundrisphaera lichenicola TaxID=2029860 RepID=UPI003EB7E3C1